jgi:nucleotide-binding universal stress UspA family protein
MFTTALVGIDLSAAEPPLLDCVADLRTWGVERVVLAHVIHVDYGRFAGLGHEQRYRSWLEERAASLSGAGLAAETSVTASGRPAVELLARAGEHGADLVVVGSRSHQLAERLFLGSVAADVIRAAEIPVLIERLEPDPDSTGERCVSVCERSLERVLLATDLSEESAGAEEAAAHLAGRAGSVDCLTVVGDDGLSAEHAEVLARALLDRITAAGGRGAVRVERGDPARLVPTVAAEGYSMVIVGKHGRGRLGDALIGSTAARVAEAAGVSVLVVPPRRLRSGRVSQP